MSLKPLLQVWIEVLPANAVIGRVLRLSIDQTQRQEKTAAKGDEPARLPRQHRRACEYDKDRSPDQLRLARDPEHIAEQKEVPHHEGNGQPRNTNLRAKKDSPTHASHQHNHVEEGDAKSGSEHHWKLFIKRKVDSTHAYTSRRNP